MEEKLQSILAKMRELTKDRDLETDHHDADGLLMEVIDLLTTSEVSEVVDAILVAYGDIEKQYA